MIVCNKYRDVSVFHNSDLAKIVSRDECRVAIAFIHQFVIEVIKVGFEKNTCIYLNFGERPPTPLHGNNSCIWILAKPKEIYDYSLYNHVLCLDYQHSTANGYIHFEPGMFYETKQLESTDIFKYSFIGSLDVFVKKLSSKISVTHFSPDKWDIDADLINNVAYKSTNIIVPIGDKFIPLSYYNVPYYRCMLLAKDIYRGILEKYTRTLLIKNVVDWDMESYDCTLSKQIQVMKERCK